MRTLSAVPTAQSCVQNYVCIRDTYYREVPLYSYHFCYHIYS